MYKLQLEFTFRGRVDAERFIARYLRSRSVYKSSVGMFGIVSWNPSFPAKFYVSLRTTDWGRIVSTMRYLSGRMAKGEFRFRVLSATETKVEDIMSNMRVMLAGFKSAADKKKGGEIAGV